MDKINAYICSELHITITETVSRGTTPTHIACPTCKKSAITRMYMVNQSFKATHEWYMPTVDELKDMAADMNEGIFLGIAEHVNQGGLLFRRREVNNG